MAYDFLFHELATKDYRRAKNWYARQSTQASRRFVAAVNDALKRIAEGPERGAIYAEQIRWMKTRRFPFVIYYEIGSDSCVNIYAIAHGRRRPGYWLRRRF
jgi:toxin ParE1/3/4